MFPIINRHDDDTNFSVAYARVQVSDGVVRNPNDAGRVCSSVSHVCKFILS